MHFDWRCARLDRLLLELRDEGVRRLPVRAGATERRPSPNAERRPRPNYWRRPPRRERSPPRACSRRAISALRAALVRVSRAAWISGYVYVAVVSLFVIIVFSLQSVSELPASDPMLLFLFGCVVAFVLMQQALTLRYVLLRPELSTLRKKPKDQLGVNIFKICGGRVLSSMDPKKWTNYIYLSVIVFEFFQFTGGCFGQAA